MTGSQLAMLSYQTCQWWNAVFIQAKRFFDALEQAHGETPWDAGDENSIFVAERIFIVIAIYHSVENLQKLDVELQRINDFYLHEVLQAIESVVPFEDIKNLRDMNEHSLDYLLKNGRKQNQFCSTVKEGNHEILTTAALTQIRGDANMILLGKVQLDKLLLVMKEQLPNVSKKTKEIFDKGMVG